MKLYKRRKAILIAIMIMDNISIGMLWFIALISLAIAIYQQLTK